MHHGAAGPPAAARDTIPIPTATPSTTPPKAPETHQMADLKLDFCGVKFKHPIIIASLETTNSPEDQEGGGRARIGDAARRMRRNPADQARH